jgi:hypothetical protein
MSSNINIKPSLKEDKTGLLVLIIIIGFAAAVVYHYVVGYYLGKPWPANTFLHNPIARFFDFYTVVRQSAALDPFGQDLFGFEGAPFGHFVGYLFSLIQPAFMRLPILFGSFFIVFIPVVKHYLYGLKSKITSYQLLTIFAIVFLTYPVLFTVDRANFILLVVPCLFLFAFTYERQKYRASTVFLALAIAIKPYAALFIIIYFLDKKFKDGLLVIFNTVFLTVLSLSLFKDGLIVETQKYLHSLFPAIYGLTATNQPAFTSDLYALLTVGIKFVGDTLGIDRNGLTMYLPAHPEARIVYAIIAIIVSIYFVIYLWKQPKPLWKAIAVLTILSILLPFNAYDYRLTCLLVPMLMYLAIKEKTKNDLLIIILWGLLLVPKNYMMLNPSFAQNIGMVINPLLLIGLLICIIPGAFSIKGIISVFKSGGTGKPAEEKYESL